MKFHYFVAAVIWIATVTATSESDSHGNWSNEKRPLKENYKPEVNSSLPEKEIKDPEEQSSSTPNPHERVFNLSHNDKSIEKEEETELLNRKEENHGADEPKQQFSKQVIQPYVLPLKSKAIHEAFSPNESLDNIPKSLKINQSASNQTVTVEYIPSQEITVQESSTSESYTPIQENGSNDLGQSISEDSLNIESIGDFGQRVRFSSPRQRNRVRQLYDVSSSSEDYRKTYRKTFRSHSPKKLNNSDSNSGTASRDRLPFTLTKTTDSQKSSSQKVTHGEYIENISTVRDTSSTTLAPIISVSLGKFSGPIVVPELPRQKKYSHPTTTDYGEANAVPKSTPVPVESLRSKVSENGYIAASQVVLNPLQVGVALMNAGQDINLVVDQITLANDKTDSAQTAKNTDNESPIQNDTPDSTNPDLQNDQESQQEHISEVVIPNSPIRSVEIQKSVEIFHTAPVQEIHYPVEFVPYGQQPLVKQRPQEDYKKLSITQSKERRPSQSNLYRYNEIMDDRGRYEYKVNENDGIADQSLSVPRPAEMKPVFEATDEGDNAEYDQTTLKHSKVQVIPSYESPKGPSSTIAHSTRLIDSLSSLVNLESLQDTQEAPKILLSKTTNEAPSELRLLMPVPQPYSVEKTPHTSHPVDISEKKIPFTVEKIIEKQVTIPQPFPVHIPVDRIVEKQIRIPYPIHVEKVIEKKIPFAIQRFIIPLPIHFRIPQPVPVPVEKIVEKPIPIPVPVEKNRLYSLENTKLIKMGPIYNVPTDGNYQQQLIRQNFQTPLGPLYGTEIDQNLYNSTGQYYGPGYLALNRPIIRQSVIHTLPKKFGSYSIQYPHSTSYTLNSNNGNYGRTSAEKDLIKDEYVGPVPRKVHQSSIVIQSKSLYSSPDIQATLRRTRQESGNTGSFRQSKMEYGFKPPMVPSVQYDEQTASKVN